MSAYSEIPVPEGYERRIVVQLATDAETDDFVLHEDVQAFLRSIRIPRRRLVDTIYDRLHKPKTLLVDEFGNRVRSLDLTPVEADSFEYFIRDWIKLRPLGAQRRNRDETKETRRLLITLLRQVWPKESTVWGRSVESLGLDTELCKIPN